MKNLKEKLRKNGGFTLVEMLIVVAIIAILIAISIPMVGNALERSREATDAANERAFKAALLIEYLNHDQGDKVDVTKACVYDAADGKVLDSGTPTAYGQGTTAGAHSGADGDHTGMVLYGYVDEDGVAQMEWSKTAITDVTKITGKTLTGSNLNTKAESGD